VCKCATKNLLTHACGSNLKKNEPLQPNKLLGFNGLQFAIIYWLQVTTFGMGMESGENLTEWMETQFFSGDHCG
jgi:hypothetical protein